MQSSTIATRAICRPTALLKRFPGPALGIAPSARRPARPAVTVPRAAAAAAAAPVPEAVWEPTGVPLVDELAGFKTLQDSGLHAIKLVAAALVGAYVGSWVLNAIASKLQAPTGKHFRPVRAVLAAAAEPGAALLPYYSIIYSFTVTGATLQVFHTKAKHQFNQVFFGQGEKVMNALKVVTQVVQDLSEIIIIVGAAWAAIRFKDIVVAYIQNAFLGGEGSQAGANRLLKSVASLMDYGIYISAGFAVIAAFGINVTPLMASLGGASVVIGLASQSILGNVASAVTLYASPPFATGDYVRFLSNGALVVEGTVLAIEPMRTIMKTKEGSTLYISNNSVVTWMVDNTSQKHT